MTDFTFDGRTCPVCHAPVTSNGDDRLECPNCKMPQSFILSADGVRQGDAAETTLVMVEIGRRGKLDRYHLRASVREVAAMLRKLGPVPPASMFVAGYDDDPRELFEIPEARDYVLRWVERLKRSEGIGLDRFIAFDTELVRTCWLAAAGQADCIEVKGDAVGTYMRDVAAYQQRRFN